VVVWNPTPSLQSPLYAFIESSLPHLLTLLKDTSLQIHLLIHCPPDHHSTIIDLLSTSLLFNPESNLDPRRVLFCEFKESIQWLVRGVESDLHIDSDLSTLNALSQVGVSSIYIRKPLSSPILKSSSPIPSSLKLEEKEGKEGKGIELEKDDENIPRDRFYSEPISLTQNSVSIIHGLATPLQSPIGSDMKLVNSTSCCDLTYLNGKQSSSPMSSSSSSILSSSPKRNNDREFSSSIEHNSSHLYEKNKRENIGSYIVQIVSRFDEICL